MKKLLKRLAVLGLLVVGTTVFVENKASTTGSDGNGCFMTDTYVRCCEREANGKVYCSTLWF